ncbi:MAG: hypothetical protein IJ494_08325 [Bacteroides sp.]|nr:hypothetical protein [Bacteroides sp.]
MTTMELDAARADIIRSLFQIEDMEVIKDVRRRLNHFILKTKAAPKEEGTEYISKEELMGDLREALTEMFTAQQKGIELPDAEELLYEL